MGSAIKPVDPIILASCFSNISEICKNIRFSINEFIYELLECIRGNLHTDQVEVQRAALFLVCELLRKMKADMSSISHKYEVLLGLQKSLTMMKRKQIVDDV